MEGAPIVISNTTPVINFAQIGRTDILQHLFGRVLLTDAVVEELEDKAGRFPAAAMAWRNAPFDSTEVEDSELSMHWRKTLHPGESACLALAAGHPGALLILDDFAAREAALIEGYHVTGTLGCLLEARRTGIVDEVAPLLRALRKQARFWISTTLEAEVLRRAGEA
jgi:predicted nucleic acid-binding protein